MCVAQFAPLGRAPLLSHLLNLLTAAAIGLAWWYPDTPQSALLTFFGALGLLVVSRSPHPLKNLFLTGCLVQLFGFYWLVQTISYFGGFPYSIAILIFLGFTLGSALQFLLYGVLFRALPLWLDRVGVRAALAWTTLELCSLRLFPWHLGHTWIAWREVAQIADLFGSLGLSFLVLWLADGTLLAIATKFKNRLSVLAACGALLAAFFYGSSEIRSYQELLKEKKDSQVEVALIQGNIPLYRMEDQPSPAKDIIRHLKLSQPYDKPNTLLIWPESAIMNWTHVDIQHRSQDPRLPILEQASLLSGVLMARDRYTTFNSAFLLQPDGTIGTPYHKRVLMPFGEYTPLSETFPWLAEINNEAANFVAGSSPSLHTFPTDSGPIQISTLICYEDVVQGLAVEATREGAEVLVNLTNDGWFQNSPALKQHHLIASFRAIENKRFHLRATNTGKTGVVNPLGITVARLPEGKEGALSTRITPISSLTLYTRYGNTPWWILTGIALFLVLLARITPQSPK
jgi:apolipoprotein N-acyltransferase